MSKLVNKSSTRVKATDLIPHREFENYIKGIIRKNPEFNLVKDSQETKLTLWGGIKYYNSIPFYLKNKDTYTYVPVLVGKVRHTIHSEYAGPFDLFVREGVKQDLKILVNNLIYIKNRTTNYDFPVEFTNALSGKIINTVYGKNVDKIAKQVGWLVWNELLDNNIANTLINLMGYKATSDKYTQLALNWNSYLAAKENNKLGLVSLWFCCCSGDAALFNLTDINFAQEAINHLTEHNISSKDIEYLSSLNPIWFKWLNFYYGQALMQFKIENIIEFIKLQPKFTHLYKIISKYKFNSNHKQLICLLLDIGKSVKKGKVIDYLSEVKKVENLIFMIQGYHYSAHEKIRAIVEFQAWMNKYEVSELRQEIVMNEIKTFYLEDSSEIIF